MTAHRSKVMTMLRALESRLEDSDPQPAENEWIVVEIDLDGLTTKFAAYIWSQPNERKLTFATTPFDSSDAIVGVAVLDSVTFATSEFQIDSGVIHFLNDCSLSQCSGLLPRLLYRDLRAGEQLRFGGEITRPRPERLFATVPLAGIDDVLDQIE